MSFKRTTNLLLAAALTLVASAVLAQSRVDVGKREYDNNCAVCHGTQGSGNGPYVELLKRSPPDLTTMARRNGGVFPVAAAYAVIDGEGTGHGTRDMPIWGQDYKIRAAEYYMEAPYDPGTFVRSRILALIEYLNRLQAK
jgi:mono/diheme cytochrome c family protein